MKFNWKKVAKVNQKIKSGGLQQLHLTVLFESNKTKQTVIDPENFMRIMWTLENTKNIGIIKHFFVQDSNGKFLFIHRKYPNKIEPLPETGDPTVITDWKDFSKSKKQSLFKILLSQICVNIQN